MTQEALGSSSANGGYEGSVFCMVSYLLLRAAIRG